MISNKKDGSLKENLKEIIPLNLIDKVKRSFEVVGDIAIIEIDPELIEYEKIIANKLLQTNKHIKTILKKNGIHKTEFRTQDLIYIAGENKFETKYKENDVTLFVNPKEVYFSSKLAKERGELFKTDFTNKKILVMFSGLGPYSIVGLKKSPNLARIDSIEINPVGHQYALKNIEHNLSIIKKSKIYIELIQFLRENKIYIKEKELMKSFIDLKCHFFNFDVREKVKDLNLEKYKIDEDKIGEIEFDNKKFLTLNNEETFSYFKEKEIINIDFDNFELNYFNNILIYLLIYFNKKHLLIKIDNQFFHLKDNFSKSFLLNYLQISKPKKFIENLKYDEIFMPLPKDAQNFLDCAFFVSQKNTIVHLYDFVHINDFPTKTETEVLEIAKKHNINIKILNTRLVGQYSPRKYRICCDFKIKK